MSISQSLLPEFDLETANTRKVLERLPGDKLDWKAHEKSLTIGLVGSHLADIPSWIELTMKHESFDVNPPGGEPYQTPTLESVQQILDLFDKNVTAGRAAIEQAKDEEYFQTWELLNGGEVMFSMPRMACLRSFIFNHSIHHRGHLCVYLRLNDIPVPALYGPSGDEEG